MSKVEVGGARTRRKLLKAAVGVGAVTHVGCQELSQGYLSGNLVAPPATFCDGYDAAPPASPASDAGLADAGATSADAGATSADAGATSADAGETSAVAEHAPPNPDDELAEYRDLVCGAKTDKH